MICFLAAPSPLRASYQSDLDPQILYAVAGPAANLDIPTCEQTLSACLEYRTAADLENTRLRSQVAGLKNHGELVEGQRDSAFDLAGTNSQPLISPELAAVGGGVLGILTTLAVVALVGAKK